MASVRRPYLSIGAALVVLFTAAAVSALEVRKTGGPAAMVLAVGIAGPYARDYRPCGNVRLPDGDGVWKMTPIDYGCLGYDTFVLMVRGAPRPNQPSRRVVQWCEAVVGENGILTLTEGLSPEAAMICTLSPR